MFLLKAVDGKDRGAFEQSVRKEGFSDFEIRSLDAEGKITKSPEEPSYYPVTYLESNDNNFTPFGVDFLSDSVRRVALEKARDSGYPAITSRIKRIGSKTENYSCLIAYPIYQKGSILDTTSQRRENLFGFIALVFEIKQTLENSRKGVTPVGINMAIYDESAAPNEQFLYYFESPLNQHLDSLNSARLLKLGENFSLRRNFDILGRHWLIILQATPDFVASINFWQAWSILICGLLLTIFISIVLFNILQGAEKVKLLVLQRTEQLTALNKALEAEISQRRIVQDKLAQATRDWENTFNAISDFVFIQDKDFTILKANLSMCKVLGLKQEEIVGRKCHEIMHKTKAPWLNCPFQKTLNDKQPHTEEVDDAHLGMPLLVSASPILDEKGDLIGSVHIAKD
ncbi:MAG: CHASE domain-containing protein, partial [Candidatus Omnitrophica bacterium]|nr:CHASE domain-containing protein [Candidatus Omnitrophota bacterium]